MIDEKRELINNKIKTKFEAVGVHRPTGEFSPLPSSSFLSMHRGYIKLWRKFEDWYGSSSPYRLSLWVWILSLATHKPQRKLFKKDIIDILPGQFLTGRRLLAQKTGISESQIERLLNEFQKEKMIEQQKSTKNRLISIVNWDDYQFLDNNRDNALDNKRTTKGQRKDTNKNVKNVKNVNNKRERPLLLDCINYFLELKSTKAEAEKFHDYYSSNGWKVAKNPMKDWKATARNWVRRSGENKGCDKCKGIGKWVSATGYEIRCDCPAGARAVLKN